MANDDPISELNGKSAKAESADEQGHTNANPPHARFDSSTAQPFDPSAVYETNAALIYAFVKWLIPESHVTAAVQAIAQDLVNVVPESGYQRYSKLLSLRTVYLHLISDPKTKLPQELSSRELTLEEALCLWLRDRLEFACHDVAAIAGSSEGSIRTRLERARERAFSTANAEQATARSSVKEDSPNSTMPRHICIRAREQIEDWDIPSPKVSPFSLPTDIGRVIDNCRKCEAVLQQRLTSLSYFQDIPACQVPEPLENFPVSPLFVKEGKRVLLNWAAAPWYVKALFEGLLATTLVLGVVLSIPRIKSLYEFWLERRLDLYSVAELASGLGSHSDTASESEPAVKNLVSGAISIGPMPPEAQPEKPAIQSEFVGRDSQKMTSEKIARILIKSDSPEGIKDQVLRALANSHFTAADPDMPAGADVPGGVMFDVFIPLNHYEAVRNELFKMGETKEIITRAKERGMAGKAHLKIWLQRI